MSGFEAQSVKIHVNENQMQIFITFEKDVIECTTQCGLCPAMSYISGCLRSADEGCTCEFLSSDPFNLKVEYL